MGKRNQNTEPGSSHTEADSPFGEPLTIEISDTIDLHPFQPSDIPSVVEEYLQQSIESGFTEVRLIHGKGKGIQRNIVRSLLSKHPAVRSFKEAPLEAGGWGSTIVVLKQRN
ncbi:MAG TPA: Smr/MutS family protein [Candidatus Binatia bacterium]